VTDALLILEDVCKRKAGEQASERIIAIFVHGCVRMGADPEAVHRACTAYMDKEAWWPAWAEFRGVLEQVMSERARERENQWWRSLVAAVDSNGVPVLAPPERVRHGRLLPEGDKSGDGSPAPSALPQSLEQVRNDVDERLPFRRMPEADRGHRQTTDADHEEAERLRHRMRERLRAEDGGAA
jgi:hypothetical protein